MTTPTPENLDLAFTALHFSEALAYAELFKQSGSAHDRNDAIQAFLKALAVIRPFTADDLNKSAAGLDAQKTLFALAAVLDSEDNGEFRLSPHHDRAAVLAQLKLLFRHMLDSTTDSK